MSTIKYINSSELKSMLNNSKLKVYDIREKGEYLRGHIPGAVNVPLFSFDEKLLGDVNDSDILVFHCQTNGRVRKCVPLLEKLKVKQIMVLDDGFYGWKSGGGQVTANETKPISIKRQLHFLLGIVVLVGVILGFKFSPMYTLISGFVGLGLTLFGLTEFCGMERLLMKLPFNKNNPY